MSTSLSKGLSSWGPHSTMDSVLASHPAAPGLILSIGMRFIDSKHCLYNGECRNLIVDRTHPVLASGKQSTYHHLAATDLYEAAKKQFVCTFQKETLLFSLQVKSALSR